MDIFVHTLEHTLEDTWMMFPFLLITYMILEVFERRDNQSDEKIFFGLQKYGPLVGAAVGLLPQCGFSILAAMLFVQRNITLGSLLAVMIATSDEAIPILLSNPSDPDHFSKSKIRPLLLKGNLIFQAEEQKGKQAFHKNLSRDEAVIYVENCLNGPFRQAEITCARGKATVLVSKKGKMTVKFKKQARMINQAALEHNRKKQYLLPEGTAVPFLVDLGVMTKEGTIVHSRYDKYRQINRFLEFIEDILPQLNKNKENVIIDFGCGKSYLTFAMYYYLKEVKGYPVRIIGLDLKEDVICHCSDLAVRYGYEKLSFTCGILLL